MFKFLWILVLAILISLSINWLVENNGEVVIKWLGYQISSDALTLLLATILLVILIFFISYFVAKILSFKFPNIFKVFFRKSRAQRLEFIVKRQYKSFEKIFQTLNYIDLGDIKNAKKIKKKLYSSSKNDKIHKYLQHKIDILKEEDFITRKDRKKGFFKRIFGI